MAKGSIIGNGIAMDTRDDMVVLKSVNGHRTAVCWLCWQQVPCRMVQNSRSIKTTRACIEAAFQGTGTDKASCDVCHCQVSVIGDDWRV